MNKLEILDKIIDIEDELESEAMSKIPDQVTEKIKQLFGDEGLSVANTYYKKESNNNTLGDECPQCEKKAKELVQFMKLTQTITDSLSGDEVEVVYTMLHKDPNFSNTLNDFLNKIHEIFNGRHNVRFNKEIMARCLIKELATKDFKHDGR